MLAWLCFFGYFGNPGGLLCVDFGVFGVGFNESPPGWYLITHQHGKDAVRFRRFINGYLLELSGFRIHSGFP